VANLHVRHRDGDLLEVVCHYPLPATTNSAGLAWRVAYARDRGALTTVLPDGDGTLGTIAAAERLAVTGAPPSVAEEVRLLAVSGDWEALTGAQQQAAIDAWYAAAQADFQERLGARLRWWGLTR
jgi:hypothetical protein